MNYFLVWFQLYMVCLSPLAIFLVIQGIRLIQGKKPFSW